MLIIAAYPGFDGVPTGGGKTHFYYMSKFAEYYKVKLITFCSSEDEQNSIERSCSKIKVEPIIIKNNRSIIEKLVDVESHYNIINRNGRFIPNSLIMNLKKILKILVKQAYNPDIIILEWTEMLLACSNIRTFFPNAKIVASEHDVTFLSKKRKYEVSQNFRKIVKYFDYIKMKQRELELLEKVDLAVTHNEKDKKLLYDNGIGRDKIFALVPYFMKLKLNSTYDNKSNKLIFYGAMSRPENYLSALWFIENVMPQLHNYIFIIIGNKPPKELMEKSSNNIIVTGYVPDIIPYFSDALCIVAPLLLGAGIKIKILEGLSSGIPVLTNTIGIEGIPARKGIDYIECNTAEDYIVNIKKLSNDEDYANYIAQNGQKMINKSFCINDSCQKYIKILDNMTR